MRRQRNNLGSKTLAVSSKKSNPPPPGNDLRNVPLPELFPTSLTLSVFSDDEIRRVAEVQITTNDLDPTKPGLMSNQMGSYQETVPCETCELKSTHPFPGCNGHLGYIQLNVPVIKPPFYKFVFYVLESVCRDCYRPLLPKSRLLELAKVHSDYELLRAIAAESKTKTCMIRPDEQEEGTAVCRNNPKYLQDSYKTNFSVMFEEKGGSKEPMPIDQVKQILDGISDEDAILLGFNASFKPKDLVTTVLPVVPPCARPPNIVNGRIEQSNMTYMYDSIISKNQAIQKHPTNSPEGRKAILELNSKIYFLIDNSSGSEVRQGRPLKTFADLMKGKEGLFRGAVMGKRVDKTARTVIGPDPALKFGQVSIPRVIAHRITIEENITSFNLNLMQKLWNSGQIESYQGTETYTTEVDGQTTTLSRPKYGFQKVDSDNIKTYQLKIGDKVNRRIQNGDRILLNRNPTLHRHSMMTAEVKIAEQLTFGLTLTVTSPFNADFDGDEMNMHTPQSIASRVEASELLNMRRCIMGDQQNGPEMGLTFDALTTSAPMTWATTRVSKSLFDQLITLATNPDKGTINDRLEKSGVTYRYQTFELEPDFNQEDTNDFIADLLGLEVVTKIINPPSYLSVPTELVYYSTGPFTVEVKISYPLNNSALDTLEILKLSEVPLRVVDEYTGRAAFSIALPANFYYRRDGSQYRIFRYRGRNEELIDMLSNFLIGFRVILVVTQGNLQELSDMLKEDKWTVNLIRKNANFSQTGSITALEVNQESNRQFPTFLLNLPHHFEIEFTDKGNVQGVDALFGFYPISNFSVENKGEENLIIRNGILISGVISKKDVSATANSIIQKMHNYFDQSYGETTAIFLTDLPWIVDKWASTVGFTLGITDCMIPDAEQKKFQETIAKIRMEVIALGAAPKDPIERQRHEMKIKQIVSQAETVGAELQKNFIDRDNFLGVTTKGAAVNINQIVNSVGQQYMNSQRLGTDSVLDRFTPYRDIGDQDITARGFIVSSFMSGVTPEEMFMSQYSGREGLIDSAIQTAQFGYMQRRIVKALENISIQYDGTTRDMSGNVIQIISWTDLMNPAELDPLGDIGFSNSRYTFADIAYLINKLSA